MERGQNDLKLAPAWEFAAWLDWDATAIVNNCR
jgi:hypothetical protein